MDLLLLLSTFCIARWSLFGSGDQVEFWEIITRFAPRASIASVHDMEEIQSDLGRVNEMYIFISSVPVFIVACNYFTGQSLD